MNTNKQVLLSFINEYESIYFDREGTQIEIVDSLFHKRSVYTYEEFRKIVDSLTQIDKIINELEGVS